MSRHTKIVATLGPASSDPEVLEKMVRAGVDVVRLNFSHGKPEDHIERARVIREVAALRAATGAIFLNIRRPSNDQETTS